MSRSSTSQSIPQRPLKARRRLEVCISSSESTGFFVGRGYFAILPVLVAASPLWSNDTIREGATAPLVHHDSVLVRQGIQYVSQLLLDCGLTRTHLDVSNHSVMITAAAGLLAVGLLLFLWTAGISSHSTTTTTTKLAVVTLYPALGVQLSTEQQTTMVGKQDTDNDNNATITGIGHPLFLPRDQILDCVVYEVILSHKVVTVVAFRIIKPTTTTAESSTDDTPQNHQLVPAFPGTEMTFQECLFMRRQILQTLGGLAHSSEGESLGSDGVDNIIRK